MRPRPSRTTAVGPSGISARNAVPLDMSIVRSVPVSTRLRTSYWRVAFEREPVEARDRGQRLDILDPPVAGVGAGGRRPDDRSPRRQRALAAALDEDLEQQLLPATVEQLAIALLDNDARGFLADRRRELVERRGVAVADRELEERLPIGRAERLFEAQDEALERVDGRRRRRLGSRGERRQKEAGKRQQEPRPHGGHILDPAARPWETWGRGA